MNNTYDNQASSVAGRTKSRHYQTIQTPIFMTACWLSFLLTLAPIGIQSTAFSQQTQQLWDMGIDSPGGPIQFQLELRQASGHWTGYLINGPERIKVPKIEVDTEKVEILIDHFDSQLSLKSTYEGTLQGVWRKRRGASEWVEMKVNGKRHQPAKHTSTSNLPPVLGRWKVKFESSEDDAVGIFKNHNGRILGTFLTTTGDYRFLDGTYDKDQLVMSCFDGAHAFLFKAKLSGDVLSGDFWSSNTWHETWRAVRDEYAKLPDDFGQTTVKDADALGVLSFPNLDGKLMKLDDPSFAGKARIIYVFGSWCPNCHDAANYFSELNKKYKSRGLSILGLAFELTGEFERDAGQVRKYLQRHDSDYPVLIAGLADKKLASKSLPLLDRVRSYPTTIFLDRNNQVKAIHTGFTGPATGEAYDVLKQKFESMIESLLIEE